LNDPPTDVEVHAAAPPVGFVDVHTVPRPKLSSAATHRETDGQETLDRLARRCIKLSLQVEAPPVGLVEVTTSPMSSTATHKEGDGHETLVRAAAPPKVGGNL
jgi:hypothetical protein